MCVVVEEDTVRFPAIETTLISRVSTALHTGNCSGLTMAFPGEAGEGGLGWK